MYKHYIILTSSYLTGQRIAFDHIFIEQDDIRKIKELLSKIEVECGDDVSLSIHSIETDDKTWESVVRKDAFFDGVRLIENEQEFIKLIREDRILTGLDVAKFILSYLKDCTHLKLEKLVYLCYAEYLCKTQGKKRLFEDKIYAYKYGPVVKSVYDKYKKYGRDSIPEKEDLIPKYKYAMSSRSRILSAQDGLEKIRVIIDTVDKYKDCSAGYLVDITHRKDSPWCHCDETRSNELISDDCIIKYHYSECISK